MISSLHGIVEAMGTDRAIINVNGVGYLVFMPTSTLNELGGVGAKVYLHTHLHVREDNLTLYGFGTPDALSLFETLLNVSGVGPKLGLSMLSTMRPEELTMAIASGNADLLTEVPGIGKKLASRIVLELKDKIGGVMVTGPAAALAQENADVLAALTSLGYSVSEASRAIAALPTDGKLTLEEKVKLALQYFGGK